MKRLPNLFLFLCLSGLACKKEKLKQEAEVVPLLTVQSTATIDCSSSLQYIRGFGGANIRGWIDDLTADQRTKAFSQVNGIGLSVLRVRISPDSTQWLSEKPTIDAAKSLGASVVASAWTAPASMKDNNSLIGGKLNAASYTAYAAHLSSFCSKVGGVTAVSPANEPNYAVTYESMSMTAAEVADFVAAKGNSCGASIMAPEPFNMSTTYISSYLSNTTAASKTNYVCGHIYGVTPPTFSNGKEIWMTEHFTNNDDANIWSGAMGVAREIHDCMTAGYSMYLWWYIRRSYGLLDESGNVTKRGYAMTHFSKWVRPGYSRVVATNNPTAGIYVTAYKNGSKLAVVIINENSAITYQTFSISGLTVTGFNRYITTSASNLVSSSFTISSGSFGINLPASSITTLISQ